MFIFQKFLRIVDDLCNETEANNMPKLQSDWCARLHLLGCGLLGQVRANDKSEIENRVEEAVQCFFRLVFDLKNLQQLKMYIL